ncbi:glycosyltransferase family 2 protein [Ascidiimonas aurantiaca]|uniref:glycosyltransferase family 2 protein n=1 Tax=Ascidiimonas aurantiaca TaxID=1685432 RepID=UPI0030EF9E10
METREKLTVIIPVYNEEHHIKDVLQSVSFADEILVVDSFSTDRTVTIAKAFSPRLLQRKFDSYASQKNWAIQQASHTWILLVDADERISPELRSEILHLLAQPKNDAIAGYWIKRINHFMGQRIHYSGWRNDKVVRLFKKHLCHYNHKRVHEEIIAKGELAYLKNRLYHYSYSSMDQYLQKLNRYAYLQAIDYDEKTGKLTPYHFVIKPAWGFVKHYFFQSGFRDGVPGLMIGYIQGYVVLMRYIKLWLHRRNRQ